MSTEEIWAFLPTAVRAVLFASKYRGMKVHVIASAPHGYFLLVRQELKLHNTEIPF